MTADHCDYVKTMTVAPIGVANGHEQYGEVTFSVPRHATLLAFTDGLVERRGETLDVGLQRLRAATYGGLCPLDNLLTKVVTNLMAGTAQDGTAIMGLRWTN